MRQKDHRSRPWTQKDDLLLTDLLRECRYTMPQICKKFGRTEASIMARIAFLRIPYRPIRVDGYPWRDDEVLRMVEMRKGGMTWFEISQTLMRSENAVYCKYQSLMDPNSSKQFKKRHPNFVLEE